MKFNEEWITGFVTVAIGIVGLATIATLVSNKSNTGSVLTSGGGAFAQMLCKALSPITGSSCGGTSLTPSVNSTITFPGSGFLGGINGR